MIKRYSYETPALNQDQQSTMSLIRKTISLTAFLGLVYTCLLVLIQNALLDQRVQYRPTPLISWDAAAESSDSGVSDKHIKRKSLESDETSSHPLEMPAKYKGSREYRPPAEINTPSHNQRLSDQEMDTVNIQHANIHSVLLRKLTANRQSQNLTPFVNNNNITSIKNRYPQTTVRFLQVTPSLYIYDAILDMRGDLPEIKLLALSSSLKGDKSVVCIFNTSNTPNHKANDTSERIRAHGDSSTLRIPAVEYEMCENHDKKYGGWIYSCAVPAVGIKTTKLSAISISLQDTQRGETLGTLDNIPLGKIIHPSKHRHTPNKNSFITDTRKQQSHVPLKDLSNVTKRGNGRSNHPSSSPGRDDDSVENKLQTQAHLKIGVCVPPLYGDINLQRIVNFVEFCRILGADRIFLYTNDIPREMLQLLQEYSNMPNSILSIVFWNIPVLQTSLSKLSSPPSSSSSHAIPPNQIIWNRGQLLAIQHCLYTQMDSFDWLLFLDIDEMLIPKKALSWQSLISNILNPKQPPTHSETNNSPNNIAAVSFESAIFFTDSENQVQYSVDYFQKLRRPKDTDKSRRKVLVRPDKIYELGIHHVSRVMTETDVVQNVHPDEALIHHYREGRSHLSSEFENYVTVFDDTVLHFRSGLLKATKYVMRYLGDAMARNPT